MLDQLVPITGFAKSYKELCNKVAEPGEFYNCLEGDFFLTYVKVDQAEIGDTLMTTDILGWYPTKADLESNAQRREGDVYIVGECAPYTRWKAQYVDYVLTWVEDGEEEKKIVKKYKNQAMLTRSGAVPEEGVYYAVGGELPYKVYGVVSRWDPVGSFISHIVDTMSQLKQKPVKSNYGEVAYLHGTYYVFTENGWEQIEILEPMEHVGKHTYVQNGNKYKLREGQAFGTLEFYSPRE